jgi:hypothetical protein
VNEVKSDVLDIGVNTEFQRIDRYYWFIIIEYREERSDLTYREIDFASRHCVKTEFENS